MSLNIKKAIKEHELEVLECIADAVGCDISDIFEQPKTGIASLSCPHCGKSINIKAE